MRASWDETYMAVAADIALRSSCSRGQNGAVVVDGHRRLIATGYNGFPAGLGHLPDDCAGRCPRATADVIQAAYLDCLSVHAEANALLFCDRRDREGGTIYATTAPCWDCAKLIANSGLHRLVTRVRGFDWRDTGRSIDLMKRCGVEVVEWTT